MYQYCGVAANAFSKFEWVLAGFGHVLDYWKKVSLPFQYLAVIESYDFCRNSLQSYHKIPIIKDCLTSFILFYSQHSGDLYLQGYHASLTPPTDSTINLLFILTLSHLSYSYI